VGDAVIRRAPAALRSRAFPSDRIAWAVSVVALLALAVGARAWLHQRVRADEAPGPHATELRLAVLAYDRVGRGASERYLDADRLAEHLEALREAGFQPVSLRQVHDAFLGGEPLPERPVLLTFDGGHRSTYETVDPLLRRMGWPAVVFLDPRLLEERHATYVYWDKVRRMVHSGIWDVGTLGPSPESARLVERRLDGYEVLASVSSAAERAADAGEEGSPPLAFENSLFGVNDASANPRRLFRLRVPRGWSGRELVERVAFSISTPAAADCSEAVAIPAARWVTATGRLDIDAETVRLTGAPRAEAWVAGAEWAQDFVFEVEVQPIRGPFWIVQQAVGSREQWRWGGTVRTLYLQRLRPGEPTEVISRVDVSSPPGSWHTVRLVKRGDGVWVEWDGARLADMPRAVSATWRGPVGVATGTPMDAGEVAFRNPRFAAIPYRVRSVSASPPQVEVQSLLRDAPCLAAISPPGLVQLGSRLAPRAMDRQLLSMVAAHGAWEMLPAVEVARGLVAEDPARAADLADLAVREGWAGIRLVPAREPAADMDAWRAAVEPWRQVFLRRGLRLVVADSAAGGAR
jgi:Polysaccharide deacetylase